MRAGDIKVGYQIVLDNEIFTVKKLRWHAGRGVEFFTITGFAFPIVPFNQEIEVLS